MTGREPLPLGVTCIRETDDYLVAVHRNVMLMRMKGPIDRAFLRDTLVAHNALSPPASEGYGVITLVERGATLPSAELRAEAVRLRAKTQAQLRAEAVLIGGDGFFASAMRAALTGILGLAQSRVPMGMAHDELAAATFVIDRLEAGGSGSASRLADVLRALRAR